MNDIFIECFGKVEDPRVNRTKKHLLMDIIALTLFAIMAGAQTFDEIELFGSLHEEWLKKHLELPNGIPSHDTINRVLSLVDHDALQECFVEWIKAVKGYVTENVIAIDGKTMKGSHQASKGIRALHVLSAYSCANGLTLGQMKVDGKTNEITVIPELLEKLAVEGSIVTIDAMGCQPDIASAIVKRDADYILTLKGNKKDSYELVTDAFSVGKGIKSYEQEANNDHGRVESRLIETLPATVLDIRFGIFNKWEKLSSFVRITYTNHTTGEQEIRHFISSLPYEDIERIAAGVRSHWQIENNLHWVLDVVFREDESRIRNENAALNFSWFRKMAVSFLSQDGTKMSNRRKMLRNWAEPDNIMRGLTCL